MLQDAMPVLSNDCLAGKLKPSAEMDNQNKCLQEMAEKLEKSEAGRKKLRQAIGMLKEKMEATEKVLQVNETLRQECEKERMRAESERKKAEEEKRLRLQIEEENLSMKEQLVRVLHRLDAVERNSKSDRLETDRVRGEMKLAVHGLTAALQAVEAAQSSLQSFEKTVMIKVNNAVTLSSKVSSLAQNLNADEKTAKEIAVAAEKTSQSLVSRLTILQKQSTSLDQRVNILQQETQSLNSDGKAAKEIAVSAEKTSQSLVSRVATLQKQNTALDHRVNHLQQELRNRFLDAGTARPSNAAVPSGEKTVPNRGMVLSKSQQQNRGSQTTAKSKTRNSGVSCELSSKFGHTDSAVDQSERKRCGSRLPAELGSSSVGKSTLSTELSSVNGFKSRIVSPEASISVSPQSEFVPMSTSAPAVANRTHVPVESGVHSPSLKCVSGQQNAKTSYKQVEALRRVKADSGNGAAPSSRGAGENESKLLNFPPATVSSRGNSLFESCAAVGLTGTNLSVRQGKCIGANNKENTVKIATSLESEKSSKTTRPEENKVVRGQRKEKLPVALLKDITKLFSKEKKVHTRMEEKFVALQRVLQFGGASSDCEQQTSKTLVQETRKRKPRDEDLDPCSRKKRSKKCARKHSSTTSLDVLDHSRTSQAAGKSRDTFDSKCIRSNSWDSVAAEPPTPVQSTPPFALPNSGENAVAQVCMKLGEQDGLTVTGAREALLARQDTNEGGRSSADANQQVPGMNVDQESSPNGTGQDRDVDGSQDMDAERAIQYILEGKSLGWDSDSDVGEDTLAAECWTRRVLHSPTIPDIPSPVGKGGALGSPSACLAPEEMSLEDIALFLDVFPPVQEDGCEEGSKFIDIESFPNTRPREESLPTNIRADLQISERLEDPDILGGETAMEEDGSNESRRKITCSLSLPDKLTSTVEMNPVVPATVCESKEDKEGPGIVQAKGVLKADGIDKSGCQETCSPLFINSFPLTGDKKLKISDIVRSAEKEDKENLRIGMVHKNGLVQVTGCRPNDSVLLPQEANVVPFSCNSTDSLSSFSCESRAEAQGGQDLMCRTKAEEELLGTRFEAEVKELSRPVDLDGFEVLVDTPGGAVLNESGRSKEIAHSIRSIRDSLTGALKSGPPFEMRSFTDATDIAAMLVETRLLPRNLVSVFVAALIEAYSMLDTETYSKQAPHCGLLERIQSGVLGRLLEIIDKVFKAEVLLELVGMEFQPKLEIVEQLQEFIIHGYVKPVARSESKERLKDTSDAAPSFHVPPSASIVRRLQSVISGSKLFAGLCSRSGEICYLQKSLFLLLRYCNKDSLWVLAAISSIAFGCGKDIFAMDESNVSGQAVRVVIFELLNDAEAVKQGELSTLLGTIGEDRCVLLSGDTRGIIDEDLLCNFVKSNLQFLRGMVGEQESDINFEAFLPKILGVLRSVISPNLITSSADSQKSNPSNPVDQKENLLRASRGLDGNEEAIQPKLLSAMPAKGDGGATIQEVDLNEGNWCCWQCTYATDYRIRSNLVKRKETSFRGAGSKALEQKFHEVVHALELVACHLGWEWTYNDLIGEHLWKLVEPGAPEITVVYVAKAIGILGWLGIEIDGVELPGVEELRRSLNAILLSDQKSTIIDGVSSMFSLTVQVAAAQSLLQLSSLSRTQFDDSPGSGRTSLDSLLKWFHALTPQGHESLPLSLSRALANFEE